jgi:5'(3')-deoxyribonucleotidase
VERSPQMLQQSDIVTTSIEEVSSNAKPLIQHIQKLPKRFKKLIAMLPHQEA